MSVSMSPFANSQYQARKLNAARPAFGDAGRTMAAQDEPEQNKAYNLTTTSFLAAVVSGLAVGVFKGAKHGTAAAATAGAGTAAFIAYNNHNHAGSKFNQFA
jgi:hypothetical protein